ncbi:hypothetical protein PgNI_06282 [Pyricularia grisea]|uniref:pH-response regulator protein palC n=1 Tax=Pyricularia grisea TaxID=148305 RepID=A0A6P8B4N8_PYRGI|nr:hypothetical protein PgNI_06282 [Pyricularia grisea]TLD10094.1 hypothetical protein PgNI_06282 [Pyricularia grisea]
MPYPFVLPTTSAFSFSTSFSCESHPSLPLNASTYRGVVRDTLKKHKRLPPSSQSSSLSLVVASINDYLRYLLAVDAGIAHRSPHGGHGEQIDVVLRSAPAIEWRPFLSDSAVPGKEPPRVRIQSLEHELFFTLSTLASALSLQARAALQPLYVVSVAVPSPEQRLAAITGATKLLLDAASIYDYLSARSTSLSGPAPCADISPTTVSAQRALALAEATLLAVFKDDPYPTVVAQDRNNLDKDWMFKAPEIPKVRAHLFARLCLAASEHAAQASSLCQAQSSGGGSGGGSGSGKIAGLVRNATARGLDGDFVRYIENLRRTARAKACRFFAIDAELGGQTGNAIGWLRAGLQELGVEQREATKKSGGLSLSRFSKEWSEKREDRKAEKGASWGADAGKMEEVRVIEMLDVKWSKQNDTMNIQAIPAPATLLAQMPSGRDMHTVKPYEPPALDPIVLESMRAPPEGSDDFENASDSEDEGKDNSSRGLVGAFPGTRNEYGRTNSSNSYY